MISFAVTAYNEMSEARSHGRRILACIRPAQQHDTIGEIVVVDDTSVDFAGLCDLLSDEPKVQLFRNDTNRGVFGNKLEAIARATNEWVITCDSDNQMDQTYLGRVIDADRDPHTWYCPSFAKTHFDYRKLVDRYTLASIGQMLDQPMAGCCLNTGNQTVHRDSFMDVFGKYRDHRADLMMPNWLDLATDLRADHYWRLVFDANDSFIFNMEWLTAGNTINVMAGLEYDHAYFSGPESNYVRAPVEKSQLNEVLTRELKRRSDG